jgi:phage anti-repressor protein
MKTNQKVIPFKNEAALIEILHDQIGDELLVECVSARELYINLGHNKEKWPRWYGKNIIHNEWFIDKRDWEYRPEVADTRPEGKPSKDFLVTIEFAKHIAMMAKTQKAHEYRNYLINCEKRLIHIQHNQLETAQLKLKHSIPLNPDTPRAITGSHKNIDINTLLLKMEAEGYIIKQEIVKVLYRWSVTTLGAEAFGARNSLSGIRISAEYHEALRKLMQKALHDDQTDWTDDL